MKVGDKVFVIDWGKMYSDFCKWENNERVPLFPWKTEIPDYSGTTYHKEHKNYKYEILEVTTHPQAGEFTQEEAVRKQWNMYDKYPETPIYLIASVHTDKPWMRCFVQIGEAGLSYLSPEQFADKEFNALKEFHKGKWTVEDRELAQKEFPKELLGVVYDRNDKVLFGSNYTKGKVTYNYIPKEYMKEGVPFIIYVSISYDGKGNEDVPKKALFMDFKDLPKMFTLNEFEY
jgi:hypothetical protein